MHAPMAWALRIQLGSTSTKELRAEDTKAKKKLSSPSARLKGVSSYNDSKAEPPSMPTEFVEMGLSLVLALVLVLGVKAMLKKFRHRKR